MSEKIEANNVKHIILCEGITDAVLLGYYLAKISNWNYSKAKTAPFERFSSDINWYKNQQKDFCAIWSVGGCDFTKAIKAIIEKELLETSIKSITIITDHDDETAEKERFLDIQNFCRKENCSLCNISQTNCNIKIDGYPNKNTIEMRYLLVPSNYVGALETFMLDALSEQDTLKQDTIKQVNDFLENFKSTCYLTKRREKIKAKLGVSLSIFSPDKIFTTINELLESVDWCKFETTHTQFKILRDIK